MKKVVKRPIIEPVDDGEPEGASDYINDREVSNDRQVGGNHYQGQKIQHWDFVIMHEMPYMEAQIFKYVLRWRDKDGLVDLYKAQHFLQKLIEVEERKAKE